MELLAIIRRMDTDGDARITYSEFADFVRRAYPAPARGGSPPRPSSANRTGGYSSPLKNTSAARTRSPVRESPSRSFGSPGPRLRPAAEDELIHSLKDLCNNEQDLERAKIRLSQCPDYNLRDAFDIFDTNRSGRISRYELYDGLNSIGVYCTYDEVDLFITRYDSSGDGKLGPSEFDKAFLANDGYASSAVLRRPSNYSPRPFRGDDCFSRVTAAEHASMWRTHIRVENAAESIRQRLAARPDFNAYEAFNSLDLNGSGSISTSELQRNLQSRGYFVGYQEAA
jgi:Ca2+-binding EF-hand superfamily protein